MSLNVLGPNIMNAYHRKASAIGFQELATIGTEDSARAQVLADETARFGNPTNTAQAAANIAAMEKGRVDIGPNPTRVQLRYLAAWDQIEADLRNYIATNGGANQSPSIPLTATPGGQPAGAPGTTATAAKNYAPYLIAAGAAAFLLFKNKKFSK